MYKKLLFFYLPIFIFQLLQLNYAVYIYIVFVFIILSSIDIRNGIQIILFLIPFGFIFTNEIAKFFLFGTLFIANDALVFLLFIINLFQLSEWDNRKISYKIPITLLMIFSLGLINVINYRLFFAELQRWAFLGLFIFVIIKRLKSQDEFKEYLLSFLLGVLISSIIGFSVHFGYLKIPDELGGITYNRDSFIDISSNFIRYMGSSGYIIMFIFPIFFITGVYKLLKIPFIFYFLSFLPVLLSFRRSVYMALLFSIIYLFIIRFKLNLKFVFRVILISSVIFLIFYFIRGIPIIANIYARFESSFTPGNSDTLLSRLSYWSGAWNMFLDHKVIGIGLNQYPSYFYSYVTPFYDFLQVDLTYAMNANSDYLQYLATTGLIGFVAIYYFMFKIMLKYHKIVIGDQLNKKPYVAMAVCLFIGFFIMGIVETPLMDKHYLLFSTFYFVSIEKIIIQVY